MQDKILVLGYFGYGNNQLDGQTVKTRNIYKLLEKYFELPFLNSFDTQCFQISKFNVLKMFIKVWKADKLVYIPAQNNLKFFFPLIFLITYLRKIPIAYVVVGGWLADFIKEKTLIKKMLGHIDLILPQSMALTERLEIDYGFKNVKTLNNFRLHNFKTETANRHNESLKKPLKLVFMARISRMKGIDIIFELAKEMNNFYGPNTSLLIDFYGQIKYEERIYFEEMIECTPYVNYRGVLQPEEIYITLSEYDALLLPTRYFTEGFPGSVLDAYIAGIPTVVTNWKYATEFVDHKISGLIARWDDPTDYIENVKYLFENRHHLEEMKKGAQKKGHLYSPEVAAQIVEPFIIN